VERRKKCIAYQGRYFEKETVTAPPQSSTRSNKVSPRTLQAVFTIQHLINFQSLIHSTATAK